MRNRENRTKHVSILMEGERKRVAPKVSIVLPAYNEADEIKSSILEMEKQTYKDREIIVVDDGSTDGTSDVVSGYARQREGIRSLRTARGGPSHARNVGIRESQGEIIFFGECDCTYEEDYLEKAVERLSADTSAGAVCVTGAPLVTKSTWATECLCLENAVHHRLLNEGKIKPFYAWVYRKDALKKVGGFDETLFQAEDKDLFHRISDAGYGVQWVPGIHWRHRRYETTLQMARGWFSRGRTRILYTLKYRLAFDLGKTILPLWLLIFGILFALFHPLMGLVVALLGMILTSVGSLKVIRLSWSATKSRRIYFWYPFFVGIRNLSLALGYSYGLISIASKRIQGKSVSWNNV